MGFRFRQSIRLGPGLRLNLGRRGASLSLGGKGLTVNLGPRGGRVTAGLPGTGLAYSSRIGGAAPRRARPKTTVFSLLLTLGLLLGLYQCLSGPVQTPSAAPPAAGPAPAPLAAPLAAGAPGLPATPPFRFTTGPANIRARPAMDAPVLRQAPGGAREPVLETHGAWVRIGAGEWVHASLLRDP